MGDEGRERLLRNIPLLEAILALNSIVQPRYGLGASKWSESHPGLGQIELKGVIWRNCRGGN